MAAAALLRSVASKMKMSRAAAAAPTHHHPSLVARGLQLHGGARSSSGSGSGPAATCLHSNQVQQGTADVSVSAVLRSVLVAGRLTTIVPSSFPFPYHRRGIHSRTSPDPVPSTPPKVLDTTDDALGKATAGMAYIALVSAAIYMHFWLKPKVDELTAKYVDLRKKHSHLTNSHETQVKELQAIIMDLEAENAELKVALDSARSQGKVV